MYKVLIVDDEEKVLRLIEGLVDWAALGLSVVGTAHDGIAAKDAIDRLRPDIVITDIRMPGVTGLDLIRDAKARYPEMDFIIVSGYRHFEYAHTAIKYGVEDYLLKPLRKGEILSTLKKLIGKRRAGDEASGRQPQTDLFHLHAELLAQWRMRGTGELPEDLMALNAAYNLKFAPGPFFALCIRPDVGWAGEEVPLRNVLNEKLARIARERLTPVCYEAIIAALPGGVFGMVNCAYHALPDVRRALNAVVEERVLLRDLCPSLRVTVGVGRVREDASAIEDVMREAEEAAAERIILGADRVLTYEEAQMPPLAHILSQDISRAMTASVEVLDADAYERHLRAFLGALTSMPGLTAQYLRRCFLEVAALTQYALKPVAADRDAMLQELCANRLERCGSIAEAEEMLIALLVQKLKDACEARRAMDTRPIRQAKQIMQARFREPLTLEAVSQQVGFHPAYFSMLFKKVTGENFLEALSAIRMDAAKQLLMDGNLGVNDVALSVGYSDVKHFTKLFKKTMGLTPNEYRKLYY